jgi:hypothetical protein
MKNSFGLVVSKTIILMDLDVDMCWRGSQGCELVFLQPPLLLIDVNRNWLCIASITCITNSLLHVFTVLGPQCNEHVKLPFAQLNIMP